MDEAAVVRFWSKVDKAGGPNACWPWVGGRDKDGYGWFKVDGRMRRAHVVSWEINHGGRALEGLGTLHHCDNPPCVNPGHLWLGTSAANSADRAAKGRSACGDRNGSRRHPERLRPPMGEGHGAARLSDVEVVAIRNLKGRLSTSDIGWLFGIRQQTVSKIQRRVSWKHVESA